MANREKVIKHIVDYINAVDGLTNVQWVLAELDILKDAFALLKAQEPRVMTLDELRMNEVYWVEEEDISRPWPIAMHHIRNADLFDGPVYQDWMGDNYNTKEYGRKWRCWTSRPTDAQRKAIPWN